MKTMKLFLALAMVVGSLTFMGCEKPAEAPKATEPKIEGAAPAKTEDMKTTETVAPAVKVDTTATTK